MFSKLGLAAVTAALCLSVLQARAAAQFDGERAFSWLVTQCELGPRVPGSPGHAALQRLIAAHADSLGLRFHRLDFTAPDPASGVTLRLANLVILAGEGEGPALWIGAHYDTRPVCDRDPDPARVDEPLTGANDGASGVAVLLHLAELMAVDPPPRPIALLFFDGEDSGLSGSLDGYCLGARNLATTWNGFGSPLAGPAPAGLIVLDMVGERHLHVPMEPTSLEYAPELLRGIYGRAAELSLDAFAPYPGPPVFDDHVPFLRAGIPAVDLIDFDFPEWHTTGDVPSVCSAESLRQVGTLVWDLVLRPLD